MPWYNPDDYKIPMEWNPREGFRLLVEMGSYRDAIDLGEMLYATEPSEELAYDLAFCYFHTDQVYSALLKLKKTAKELKGLILLARCYIHVGDYTSAYSLLSGVSGGSELSTGIALNLLATCARKVTLPHIAIRYHDEALRMLPYQMSSYRYLIENNHSFDPVVYFPFTELPLKADDDPIDVLSNIPTSILGIPVQRRYNTRLSARLASSSLEPPVSKKLKIDPQISIVRFPSSSSTSRGRKQGQEEPAKRPWKSSEQIYQEAQAKERYLSSLGFRRLRRSLRLRTKFADFIVDYICLIRGEIAGVRSDLEGVFLNYGRISRPTQYSSVVMASRARALFECDEKELAEASFRHCWKKHPHYLKNMDIYSSTLWHLRLKAELLVLASQCTHHFRFCAESWCIAGNAQSARQKHKEAISCFRRAIQLKKNYPLAYYLLGYELMMVEEYVDAEQCFIKATSKGFYDCNAWFANGLLKFKLRDFSNALRYFDKAYQLNKKKPVFLCYICLAADMAGKTKLAAWAADEILEQGRDQPFCRYTRATYYYKNKEFELALEEMREFNKLTPINAAAYFLLGRIHLEMGNPHRALMNFSWATTLNPSFKNIQWCPRDSDAIDAPLDSIGLEDDSEENDENTINEEEEEDSQEEASEILEE